LVLGGFVPALAPFVKPPLLNLFPFSFSVFFCKIKSGCQLQPGQCKMIVTRQNLFQDSFRAVIGTQPYDLKRRLFISFQGEAGLDYGGLARLAAMNQQQRNNTRTKTNVGLFR
jgi:hypothetical protein